LRHQHPCTINQITPYRLLSLLFMCGLRSLFGTPRSSGIARRRRTQSLLLFLRHLNHDISR
jgi:hypothetical protein